MRRAYFDHAATTPMDPLVLQEMMPYFGEKFGNPLSLHFHGQEADGAMEGARSRVARLVGAKPEEIYFTSGGTEADNLAILGTAGLRENKGCHVITTGIEHPAVLNTVKRLEALGHAATYLPVDPEGIVRIEDLESALRPDTKLISVMHANNEIGTVQPIEEAAKLAKERGVAFHTDAVQTAGKLPLDVGRLGVDMLSMSGHKIYGPKGVGAIYIRRGVKVQPLMFGGSHERGMRPSTSNVPGIIGFGKAAELAAQRMDSDVPRIKRLRDRIIDGTLSIKETYLTGHGTKRLPNLASFRFRFIEGESLLLHLDMAGIAASTGSACSSKSLKASHVLLALGLPQEEVHGSLRVSLGRGNSDEDVDQYLRELPPVVDKLRKMSPLAR